MQKLPRSLAPLFAFALTLALILAAGPLAAARSDDAAPLVFEVISTSGLESRSAEEPGAAAEPTVALVRVDHGLVQRDPDAVSVPLPGGGVAVAQRSWWSWISADEYHWFGEIDGAAGAVAFHYYDGRLIGSLRTGDAEYRIEPEDGFHRLVRAAAPFGSCGLDHLEAGLDAGLAAGPDLESIASGVRSISAAGTETECFAPMTNVGIDVMVLYPQTLKARATEVNDYAVSRVAEANSLFALSGVKITYNLRYVGAITGVQPPGPSSGGGAEATEPVLAWLNDQFATMPLDTEVELLRRAHGADMIAIVVPEHPNANCGIANLAEKRPGFGETLHPGTQPFGTRAFSALEIHCGNSDFTFAHELGHNYGMRHDPNPASPRTTLNILDWAYGYHIPLPTGTKATVMGCVTPPVCQRIMRFSNPDVLFQGLPTGVHSNQSPTDPRHNACVANVRAAQYGAFASPPPTSPPSLTITSPADGAVVQAGIAFNLVASATDVPDGNLASQVQWTSDRDGSLGTGSPRSVALSTRGPHLITARVTDSSGTTVPYSIRLVVQDLVPPEAWIDFPSHNQIISGTFPIQGWATDSSRVTSVTFRIDGVPTTLPGFVYGTARGDVCAVYAHLKDPNCPNVGFVGNINAGLLANGTHTLTAIATDAYGNTRTVNRTFRSATLATFEIGADAWTSQAAPTTNFGNDPELQMRATGSNLTKHAYMKVQVTGITRPVLSAKLRVHTGPAAFGWYSLYWITDTTWQEGTINWNNGPLAHTLFLSLGAQPANTYVELDVTQIVSGNGTYTFGMVGPDVPGLLIYGRTAHFTRVPSLKVLY